MQKYRTTPRKELQTIRGAALGDDRRRRGLVLAATQRIRPERFGYRVQSETRTISYLVVLKDEPSCTCPYFQNTGLLCKHVYAVQATLENADLSGVLGLGVERHNGRDWAAYTDAQLHEAELFVQLLRQLCNTVESPPQQRGRPRMPLADMLCGIGLKVYSTLSMRRAMTSLRNAGAEGLLSRVPDYSTIIRYMEKPELTSVLRSLIQESALPLRNVEVDFAQDSTGFSTSAHNRWQDMHYRTQRHAVWVKLHAMCGVKTNIVTVAEAAPSSSADSNYLPDFVRVTAQHFQIHEVSADKAYSSHKNLRAVADVGATPFIPFKANASPKRKSGDLPDESIWEQMFHLFSLYRADFDRHYHKRSNVETAFYMMKAKFGEKVRARTPTAQANEVLAKVLCHNLCVLVRAMYDLGIAPEFGFSAASSSRGAPDEKIGAA